MKSRAEVGRLGEDGAARHLEKLGYRIVARNYRGRYGEIDIIALDGKTTVFVEVKTRSQSAFGSPEESVDIRKQRKIITTAGIYIEENGLADKPLRFDVVAIEIKNGVTSFNLIKNAFEAEEA